MGLNPGYLLESFLLYTYISFQTCNWIFESLLVLFLFFSGVPGTDYVPTTVVPTTSFPLHFERMSSNDPAHPANVKLVPTTLPMSPRVKKFYHFQLAGFLPKLKISFDRLGLLAMLGSDFVSKIFSQFSQIFSRERNWHKYDNCWAKFGKIGVLVNFIIQELKFCKLLSFWH